MRTALITTTINIPKVLELYRAHDPDVRFFVALERNGGNAEINNFVDGLDNAQWCYGDDYKCSELIGWKQIARRNIAMLEALKWGAELIITIDDDNIPLDWRYFADFKRILMPTVYDGPLKPFSGLQATSPTGWLDIGQLFDPPTPHRGIPHVKEAAPTYSFCVGKRIGVAAGICLGDTDCSAVTRIARRPSIHNVSELIKVGIVVDPAGERRPERMTEEGITSWRSTTRGTLTVWNSQNTALVRELAPAFFMIPHFKRFDDILGSLVVQRIMRDKGYVVHFGRPFVVQERNEHDLLKDIAAEQWGSEHILAFADWLERFIFKGDEKVTDCLRVMFTNLPDWMPDRGKIQEMVMAWAQDCDEVMK